MATDVDSKGLHECLNSMPILEIATCTSLCMYFTACVTLPFSSFNLFTPSELDLFRKMLVSSHYPNIIYLEFTPKLHWETPGMN